MTPEEKKRVAFIKKDFHAAADFTNAYIVFAHAHPDRAANVAPLMDPYGAAKLAATRVNGTVFNGRTIRVDLVRASASTAETARAKSQLWIAGTDPKKSIFVGNLGLEEKEEGVRAFFETLLQTERGEVPPAADGDEAAVAAGDRWVVNVRIIRDKGTGLGKGFAYVATRVRLALTPIWPTRRCWLTSLDDRLSRIATASTRCLRCPRRS
jgi:nucleolar protein 12